MEKTKYDDFYSPRNDGFYSRFQYAELRPEEHRIRLLRIHRPEVAEEKSTTIRCDLLDDICMENMRGKYTTISYCAGDPRNTETIIVNGLDFNAFANLGHALRQARHFWKDRYDNQELLLWADQVCINQSNTSERSHQVNFMGKIYANAEQVLISLSSESSPAGGLQWLSTEVPVDTLYQNEVKHYGDDARFQQHVLRGLLEFTNSTKILVQDYFNSLSSKEDSHSTWDAFATTVVQSPWWTRAWTRQEFLLSTDAHFMATFEYLHWKGVLLAIALIVSSIYQGHMHIFGQDSKDCTYDNCFLCVMKKDKSHYFLELFRAQRLLQGLPRRMCHPETLNLLVYLEDVYMLAASDPRDLIYANLGLSSFNYGIQSNYSKDNSVEDVLVDLSRRIQNRSRSGSTFLYALVARRRGDPKIPSWVIDWRQRPREPPSYPIFYKKAFTELINHALLSSVTTGGTDRTLRVRGSLRGALQSFVEGSSAKPVFRTTEGNDIVPWGEAQIEDEVWMIYGADNLYIFRRRGRYHELVAAIYGLNGEALPELPALIEEVTALTEANDPSIQEIEIC